MTQAQIISRLKAIKSGIEKHLGQRMSMVHLLESLDSEDVVKIVARRAQEIQSSHPVIKDHCIPIDGWSVRQSRDGYYRMYKTIEGKTECVYLGKTLSWEKARRKIAKKEKQLGFLF